MGIVILLVLSIAGQIVATILALRLISLTGRATAWLLISLGLLLMLVRRCLTLYEVILVCGYGHVVPSALFIEATMSLVIACVLLSGMALIRPIFLRIKESEEMAKNMSQSLDSQVKERTAECNQALEELQQTQAELVEKERLYRVIVENAQEGIWLTDGCARTLYVNPRIHEMLGYTEEEMLGRKVYDFVEDDLREMAKTSFQQRRLGDSARMDFRFRRKDGHLIWAMLSLSPIFDENGGFQGVLGLAVDITDRKSSEEVLSIHKNWTGQLNSELHARTKELKNANRVLDAFIYAALNDLKTPLLAIEGNAISLANGIPDISPEHSECIDKIRIDTNRLNCLIDNLHQYSQVTRAILHKQTVDLTEVANMVVADIRSADLEREVEISIQTRMQIEADPELIRIMLKRLISNAWKFTKYTPHAVIRIGGDVTNCQNFFYVQDNGIGFSGVPIRDLFQPFYRLHTDAEYNGNGLGLAIVERIARKHGGRVWAESEKGHGATFFFTTN